jgi:DNA-binding LacI/PurR family transcriptional regulator
MLLCEQISQKIKNKIQNDQIKPGQKLPSVSMFVKELNVNPRTVLSAFEFLKKDGIIHCEPRKRAVVAADMMKKQHTMLFVRWCGDPFTLDIAKGVQQYLRQIDQEVIIVDASNRHENFLNTILYPPEGTDGLILMPFEMPEYVDAIRQAQAKGLKIVFVDRVLSEVAASSVVSDNFAGAYQATIHLIESHHQPVYYLGDISSPSSARERVRGWRTAMLDHNYLDTARYLWELSSAEAETSEEPAMNWFYPKKAGLSLFEQVKADRYCIFAENDNDARGIYMAAEEKGLKIGKDVFIVGFDDSPFCTKLSPSLSSVLQLPEKIGYEAARLLHMELTGAITKPFHQVLPVELKRRESSLGL